MDGRGTRCTDFYISRLSYHAQTRLPKLPTRLSEQLRTIISTYETRRNGRRLPLYIARQNLDGIEIEFSNLLIEDANNDNLSYVDYLCLCVLFQCPHDLLAPDG